MTKVDIKAAVRQRDGRCVDCGMANEAHFAEHGRALDVHRLRPGVPYAVDGCVAVCRSCHRDRHTALRAAGVISARTDSSRDIRISEALCVILDGIADQNATTVGREVNRAVREYLTRIGKWPPSDRKS